MNLIPYRYGYTRAALDAFDSLLSSAPFNRSLIKLSICFVNHFLSLSMSSIQMDFDNTPMLSKLKVLLLAFTAIENFGSSTKRRFYKSFLMVSMSPPRRSQSLFLGDLQWRPILMSAEHSFYDGPVSLKMAR